MTVTRVEAISKSRSRVFLDEQFAFVLYKGELRKYQVEEGKEVSDEILEELRTQVLPRRAKLRAMNLLKNRQYTEKQLMDKLMQGGCGEETARQAVEYVKSYHYVDDRRYACEYIACRMGKHSLKEIEQKLMLKGIDRELYQAALEELEENGMVSDEETAIRHLLEKKHCTGSVLDQKEKRRIYAYFYRKGFSVELVRRVMEDSFT